MFKTDKDIQKIESAADADDVAIAVDDVTMVFNMASQQMNSLKEYFIAIAKHELFFKEFKALRHISLTINKGDTFGIVGTNGSGKSTLLKIIAGVLDPTEGNVTINGNIAPLIELGAGFDMDLTARENIYLNGALLGYSKKYIDENFEAIVDFAEVRDFLELPMKNYSSGMVARVAFSIATIIVPDILIVDEALSVGDMFFQQKCEERIQKLIKEHGTTVLFVSHSIDQVERVCQKAVWIEKGVMRMLGDANEVCEMYRLLSDHRLADSFTDLDKSAWYMSEEKGRFKSNDMLFIDYVLTRGIMSGYGGTDEFRPNAPASIAQFTTMLFRSADQHRIRETTEGDQFASENTSEFENIEAGCYYTAPFNWASENGILKKSDGLESFDPEAPISRELTATMLYRYCEMVTAQAEEAAKQEAEAAEAAQAAAEEAQEGAEAHAEAENAQPAMEEQAGEGASVSTEPVQAAVNAQSAPDWSAVSPWAQGGVSFCLANEILELTAEGAIDPYASIERCAIAKALAIAVHDVAKVKLTR